MNKPIGTVALGALGFMLLGTASPNTQSSRKPAIHPIVRMSSDLEHCELIGGVAGKKWIEQEELGKSLKPGSYTVYSGTKKLGVARGSVPDLGTDPPDHLQYYVKF